MMSEPKLLLLDEPSLGLAPIVVDEIFEAIVKLCGEGMTVLVAEESTKKVFRYADRAYVAQVGRIVLEGAIDQVRGHPDLASAFLGQSHMSEPQK